MLFKITFTYNNNFKIIYLLMTPWEIICYQIVLKKNIINRSLSISSPSLSQVIFIGVSPSTSHKIVTLCELTSTIVPPTLKITSSPYCKGSMVGATFIVGASLISLSGSGITLAGCFLWSGIFSLYPVAVHQFQAY